MDPPNFHFVKCCASCEFGVLTQYEVNPLIHYIEVKCGKYGYQHPAGICDNWEED